MFFLELSCFFNDPTDGNLISGSSAFSKTSLTIWKFMVHVFLKPGLENFEHYFTSVSSTKCKLKHIEILFHTHRMEKKWGEKETIKFTNKLWHFWEKFYRRNLHYTLHLSDSRIILIKVRKKKKMLLVSLILRMIVAV